MKASFEPNPASTRFKVGIVGAGAIGGFLGGVLAADQNLHIVLIGRQAFQDELNTHGLHVRYGHHRASNSNYSVTSSLSAVASCDLVFVTVKALALATLLPELKSVLRPDVPIVAWQNGVGIAEVYQQVLPNPILRGIVPFNVVKQSPGCFVKASSGDLLLPQSSHPVLHAVAKRLALSQLPFRWLADPQSAEYGKLVLNLNNALNAIIGLPLRQQLLDARLRRILALAMQEWLQICKAAQIKPMAFAAVPAAWLPSILCLPTPVFKVVARSMLAIEPFARSSMWDDVHHGRATEIEFLNGAVVALGHIHHIATPVNQLIVQLIRQIEQGTTETFTSDELWQRVQAARRSV